MCGDSSHPAAAGSERVARGSGLPSVVVEPGATGDASLRVNHGLASAVRAVAGAGELPLVIAGSCDASLGVLAGVGAGCGIVWLDAHGDFNTPASTESGFLPGMSLAIAVELDVTLPGFDEDGAAELVRAAHEVCPYSNATRGNIAVVLSANGHAVETTDSMAA